MRADLTRRILAVVAILALATGACASDDRTDAAVQEAVDALVAAGVPGAIVMVSGPTGTETAVAGFADPGGKVPLRIDDAMPIGGLTTTYVSTVALLLEADGALFLGDSVEDFLPGQLSYGWDIAMYDLLQHTSGVPDYVDVGEGQGLVVESCLASDRCAWTARELVELVDQDPPVFGPGEGWGYSNTNYVLAGEILESVTGESWDRLVTDRLLTPLGLSATRFEAAANPTDDEGRPVGHADVDGDGDLDEIPGFVMAGAGPEGAMIADAADVMGFFRPLLRGDILSEADQTALFATAPTSFGHEDYGLGVSFTFGFAQPQVGNTGEAVGYSSFVEHNRDTDVTTVILLTQSGGLPTEEWAELLRVATDVPERAVSARAAESGPGQLRLYCTLDPTLLDF